MARKVKKLVGNRTNVSHVKGAGLLDTVVPILGKLLGLGYKKSKRVRHGKGTRIA